jgi:nucleotide-binding universal stress UspA family protein
MFERIVVPLDGTPLSEHALGPAVSVARDDGAHLYLATVEQPAAVDLEPSISILDSDYLESVAAKIRHAGVTKVSTRRLQGGKVSEVLEAYRKELGAGLTVMSTHGRSGVQRAWLGSVGDELLRTSEAPVLLVRGSPASEVDGEGLRAARRFRRILVALDFTHFSRQALDTAARLGGKAGTVYVLAHVVRGSADPEDEKLKKERVLAEAKMKLEVQGFAASGYEVESVTDFAPSVAQGILDLAGRRGVEAIVIATHGRSGVGRLVLGSVADEVVRNADLPVLVVRPGGP